MKAKKKPVEKLSPADLGVEFTPQLETLKVRFACFRFVSVWLVLRAPVFSRLSSLFASVYGERARLYFLALVFALLRRFLRHTKGGDDVFPTQIRNERRKDADVNDYQQVTEPPKRVGGGKVESVEELVQKLKEAGITAV
ncbi:hypothetical protein NMY22_g2372 [Coprinellus aureogranulatus]|nr:hypothetical protein NMY22_g2372 [Coprinellus aureogranulatus]